jgi:hypothetical protein
MAVLHYTVTLSGAAQALSTLIIGRSIGKQIIFSADGANANPVYLGGRDSGTISSSDYGFRVEKATTGVPPAPTIIEAINISPADFQVIGTNNEKLHVTVISS